MTPEPIRLTPAGLYCEAGDFYIDPWRSVERAIITHAHSDHARWGMGRYLVSREGFGVTQRRLGEEARIEAVEFGESLRIGDARVSLHPAGHILGSAQVRVEVGGRVAVVSGDYKTAPDPTCTPFEPVRCHLFVTESTFGLPIYRWREDAALFAEVDAWWAANQSQGRCSVLYGYALGKSQRLLAGLSPERGPIIAHGALSGLNDDYRAAGVALPPTLSVGSLPKGFDFSRAMVLAPPSAHGSPWMGRFGDTATGYASGWMAVRGTRRRRGMDRGFAISDHVDWPSLLNAIQATGAERVWVTHGYTAAVSRYLCEQGLDAQPLETQFQGEVAEEEVSP